MMRKSNEEGIERAAHATILVPNVQAWSILGLSAVHTMPKL